MRGVDLGIDGIGTATPIGRGSAGAVYRARQEAFNRTVAVKVLRAQSEDDADRRRFDDEGRAIVSLSRHPHVLAVFAAGTTSSNQPYRIMEYLPRGSLAQRWSREGGLGPDEVIDIGIKLAGALDAAHRVGIVHANLKPENVMVSATGEPQLTDFGAAPSGLAAGAGSAGTDIAWAHIAPEVFAGEAADARSDVYSLGSVLCTLLAGAAPSDAVDQEDFHPLLDRVFIAAPEDLRPPGVPDELWEVVEGALSEDPGQRWPSAAVLAEKLEAAKSLRQAGAGGPAAPAAPFGDVTSGGPTKVPVSGTRARLDLGRRIAVGGTKVKLLALAAFLIPLAVGALLLARPDDRRAPTDLRASGVVPTTVAPPTSTTVPRFVVPGSPGPPASFSTTPRVEVPEPQVVKPAPPPTTPSTTPRTTPPAPVPTSTPPTSTTEVTPPAPPRPATEKGTVFGCDSFGQNCDDIPIYAELPPVDADAGDAVTLATVTKGTELRARCWSEGARTYNFDATAEPPDPGPDPYQSDVYFNVQVLGDTWGWISDTTFVRDKGLKLGLPRC